MSEAIVWTKVLIIFVKYSKLRSKKHIFTFKY